MADCEEKIARANARADRIGKIGRHFVGPVKPEYYDAYMTVRPLLARLTTMSTRGAYRSFKMIGQLQRICHSPYIPLPIKDGEAALIPVDDPSRTSLLRNCAILCSAVYPLPSVLNHGFSKVRNTKQWFVMKYRIEHLIRSCKVIVAVDQGDVCMPAHAICIDEKSSIFYIVIRGSTTPEDFITNLMCDSIGDLGPHRGMSIAAENIDIKIRPYVKDYASRYPKLSIILTGHSLGAGVASLICTRWNRDDDMIDICLRTQCIALACPAIFHEKDSYADNPQIKTIIFGKDLVPRLSYSSFNDLLIQMISLSKKLESKERDDDRILHANDAISLCDNSTRATTIADEEEIRERETSEDDDWELFPELISSKAEEDLILIDKIDYAGLTESECRDETKNLIQALNITKSVSFGGASFNQINTLIRKNLKIYEKRKELILVETTPSQRFSCRWWFIKTVYKVVKLWHRIFYRSREKIQSENTAQELKLLSQCYNEISNLKLKNDNRFTPPGQIFHFVPKIHFLEQNLEPPNTRKAIHGQCYMFEIHRHQFIDHALLPNWTKAAIHQHGMECYLQALAPDTLKTFPIAIAAEETLIPNPE